MGAASTVIGGMPAAGCTITGMPKFLVARLPDDAVREAGDSFVFCWQAW